MQNFILKPNASKLLQRSLILLLIGLAGLTIVALFLNAAVGLDTFLIPFEYLHIDTSLFFGFGLTMVIVAVALVVAINCLFAKKTGYLFYPDKLIMNSKIYPYNNIVGVRHMKGLLNSWLHTGTIIIELSGMKIAKAELQYIDEPEQKVAAIQRAIAEYKQSQQMQYAQSQKIDRILNRY